MEKIVHTAKQVVNAMVLAVRARFCWDELMSDKVFYPFVFYYHLPLYHKICGIYNPKTIMKVIEIIVFLTQYF
jgi:hypothetical protein